MESVLQQLKEIKNELKKLKPNQIIVGKCCISNSCRCQQFVTGYRDPNMCDGCIHHLSYHAIHEPDIKITMDPKFMSYITTAVSK